MSSFAFSAVWGGSWGWQLFEGVEGGGGRGCGAKEVNATQREVRKRKLAIHEVLGSVRGGVRQINSSYRQRGYPQSPHSFFAAGKMSNISLYMHTLQTQKRTYLQETLYSMCCLECPEIQK